MQISNKLNTADFVELQKILMERYEQGAVFVFVTKYLVNFLYGMIIFMGFYFILSRFAGMDGLIVPALTGLLTFALLLYYHPKIFLGRLSRAIEKAYAKADINIERHLTLEEDGLKSIDEKGEKYFRWTDFERMVKSAGNYFFKVKDQDDGFIIKADHLSEGEVQDLERYLAMTGLIMEERSHGK